MTKHTLLLLMAAALLGCSLHAFAQVSSAAKGNFLPVIVQEASSKEFEADRDKLGTLCADGDLSRFLSTADQLSKKWLVADQLSYYGILSAACSDLTNYSFGFSNLSKQHAAAEKYAMDALTHDETLALGMRAFFVQHLTYAPGYGLSGPTGQEWSRLRSRRLALRLGIWRQIRERTVDHFSPAPREPKLPPHQFISGVVINNGVNPSDITDAAERRKYMDAIARYQNNLRLAQEQSDLRWVTDTFLLPAVRNIITEYSAAPDNTSELKLALNKSGLAPDIRAEILTAVKNNIRHHMAAGGQPSELSPD